MKVSEDEQYPVAKTLTETLPTPLVDNVGGNVVYRGWAPLGTKEDDPMWKITKESVSGTVTKTEYADGDMKYDNKWSDRATLQYAR